MLWRGGPDLRGGDGAAPEPHLQARDAAGLPTSRATHSIWTVFKAGETVYQTGELPKSLKTKQSTLRTT